MHRNFNLIDVIILDIILICNPYTYRTLLNINPGNGTKRAGKRKKTIIHPSVVALSKAIRLFQLEDDEN